MTVTETIELGGRTFELEKFSWGKLKRLVVVLSRVGKDLAAGRETDLTLDDMSLVLSMALGITVEEVDAMSTNQHEIATAFRTLLRVTGLEKEMAYQQELLLRQASTWSARAAAPAEPH